MAGYYDKDKIKESLDIANIYDLLVEFGGEPEYDEARDNTIISQTICHNLPGEGSRKLYYYENDNTGIFKCYTDCDDSFDVFELVIKVFQIQKNQTIELYDAMNYIANFFGLEGEIAPEESPEDELSDWAFLKRYADISSKSIPKQKNIPILKEFNPIILTRFTYPIITSWEEEGINREVYKQNFIGYYPTSDQITIPHFDINNRLVGLRGRFLASDDAEKFGKYKPLVINRTAYNHPLSANLYHLNKSKDNIRRARTAIVFEAEKSTLLYQSIYGSENDISCACCGSNISSFQVELLRELGVAEIIVAFDRQFQDLGDKEFDRLTKKLTTINNKYSHYVKISLVFDKEMITSYKASPIDEGQEKFEYLLKERIIL